MHTPHNFPALETAALVTFETVYGDRVRVSRRDLDSVRVQLPLYNQFGRRVSQSASRDPKKSTTVHRDNLVRREPARAP